MQEKEVRAVIKDPERFKVILYNSKARHHKEALIEDRLYDTPTRTLKARGEKLRIRIVNSGMRGYLCWKGTKDFSSDVKSREEIQVGVNDWRETSLILESLGYIPTKVIRRKAQTFSFRQTKIRLEYFPVEKIWLAEIEGDLKGISEAKALFPKIDFGPYTLNELLKKRKDGKDASKD